MTKTLVLLALPLAVGCIRPAATSVSEAIPTEQEIRINLPDNEDTGDTPAALGDLSEYYTWTRGITKGVNSGAASVLILVHTIVQNPPTSVDGNVYTWGPGSKPLDPADYRLTVVDNLDGSYDWALDGRSKIELDAEFQTIFSGHAIEGEEAHRGSGDFVLDLDVMRDLDPTKPGQSSGSLTVVYDLENTDDTPATLEVHIDGTTEFGAPIVADYFYAENVDRSGDFQFSLPVDIGEDGSAQEDLILRSRWLADGSGRGDARISGGDIGSEVVEASQCWDTSFRTVYYADSHEILTSEGEVSDCAFAEKDLPDA